MDTQQLTLCIVSTGTINPVTGYASRKVNGRSQYDHRLVWEEIHGPIPPGLQIDHVKARGCTNKACVNLEHLELVTPRENVLRGESLAAQRARQTHCWRGHEFTPDNTYSPPGRPTQRDCRTCTRIRKQGGTP